MHATIIPSLHSNLNGQFRRQIYRTDYGEGEEVRGKERRKEREREQGEGESKLKLVFDIRDGME